MVHCVHRIWRRNATDQDVHTTAKRRSRRRRGKLSIATAHDVDSRHTGEQTARIEAAGREYARLRRHIAAARRITLRRVV